MAATTVTRDEARAAACERIAAVTLTSSSGAGDAEFHVEVNQKWTKLETSARLGEERQVDRVVSYEQKTEGERLSRELSLTMRDRIYESTVLAAAQLLGTA